MSEGAEGLSWAMKSRGFEEELIDALRGDVDLLTGHCVSNVAWYGSVRQVVSTFSRSEALTLIARGGKCRIAAFSEHSDGRVREAAIRSLEPDSSAALPALLKRANDWVPVVARLAGERAMSMFPDSGDKELLEALPLVFALTRQSRIRHGRLIWAYEGEVGKRKGLAAKIRKAYRNGAIGRWVAWHIAGADESHTTLVQESLRSGSPAVQLEAARRLAPEPGKWRELLDSRNPQVRRLALDFAPSSAVEEALTDENAGVRNDSRYLLGKRDYAAHYRTLLPASGAVSGLGETGERADAEVLRSLLAHPKADVRHRALESVSRLIEDAAAPELFAALRDPSRKVQRAAAEGMIRSSLPIDPEAVAQLDLSHAVRGMLLNRSPRWEALLIVLRQEDYSWERWLRQWADASRFRIAQPSADELARANALLSGTPSRWSPETEAMLRAALDVWHSRL